MTKPKSIFWRRLGAGLWLLLVLAVLAHNAALWLGGQLQPNTDLLAMLPQQEQQPGRALALRQLADAASGQVVVLIGGRSPQQDEAQSEQAAEQAGDAYAARLQSLAAPVHIKYQVPAQQLQQWLGFYAPYRQNLLTASQAQRLQQDPTALAQQAWADLYRPIAMPRWGRWEEDPLNLFGEWLGARGQSQKIRVRHGRLSLQVPDAQGQMQPFVVLLLQLRGTGFALREAQALPPLLAQAETAARAQHPQVQVRAIGIPLFAAAAAAQAEHEINTIGWGSLLGMLVLTWLAFRSLRPRLLVTLSIAVGLLTAVSVSALVFRQLHVITLVFGASLVGVAENYGTHYFCQRLGLAPEQRWAMLRQQAPAMALAMLTTVIGYLLLSLTPFPGLQQIAVFSAVGLVAAFLTVLLWFPHLDRGALPSTRFSLWVGGLRARWPRLQGRERLWPAALALLVLLLLGGQHYRSNDDIRLLQNAPAALLQQQQQISAWLDWPSPAQFYLVQGANPEQVLQREEALIAQLGPQRQAGHLRAYQAVSDWLPSLARQQQHAALWQQAVHGPKGVLAQMQHLLGDNAPTELPPPHHGRSESHAPAAGFQPLTPEAWLAAPVSEPLRAQWLGRLPGPASAQAWASVVLLQGVQPQHLPALAAVAQRVPGVQWVDKVGEVSELMARYRLRMAGVIGISYALVFAALSWRFGRQAWRALLPTLLASLLALSLLALAGQSIQLFHVLALLLILGMGVDYGIFLLQQPQQPAPFLSISLAAVSTLLSFGLLALSATPALHAFGCTMLLGITGAWLLTPMLMPHPIAPTAGEARDV